ncbi:uncharacterized protein UMAG_04358 [Mycosarcoma maydis]|uniref:Acyltransferase 3 domain-containing protein n=1 Tax=Mycosarcoma maydis TaxID=5270 RepID=A0A0D1DSF5_MYCMD|nr:uncharacterized protein UMAG_04358 [Ustilago maydis 521]KIS67254.1 hypothetical protein UMAG_04358 [Ustilago maydis 521]|eukprot:XP_011391067.1 hypothetical protein UMAG_04358 [Ustilago maydis 521]
MASRYSLSAELPATRKSLRLAKSGRGSAEHVQQQLSAMASTPGPAAQDNISVGPQNASTEPLKTCANNQDVTVRRHLSNGYKTNAKSETDAFKSQTSDCTYDDRGYLVLKPADVFGLTANAFTQDQSNDQGRPRSRRLAYLEGLRGILGIQVLLWTFFRIFAPAIVADRDIDGVYPAAFVERAPGWQSILRKVLSPLLFDGELQAAFFIILSGRASLQTFIERRQAVPLAGAAFKRPFRFIFPMAVTLALVSLVVAVNGFRYAPALSSALENQLARPPVQWKSALEYFNSLLFFMSTPLYFKTARATSFIPPSGTLWIVPVLFQQTYVMIILAFTLPFTVLRYKNLGMILLILTTAWVGRFSWYTLTGLLLAEWATVYRQLLPRGRIPLDRAGVRSLPAYVPGLLFVLLGVMFKYLWIAGLPADANNEIIAHVDGHTGKLNYSTDPASVAYPRYDNWLLATGLLYLVELFPRVQRLLSSRPLVYLGRWAFSISLISGTLMLSLGSLVWHHLTTSLGWTSQAAILAVLFLVLIPSTALLVDAYSRLVDDTTLWFSNWLFKWIRV